MMSHGTFLELLELAAMERGLRARIELFPEGEFAPEKIDNRPVAHIWLSADATVKKDPLFSQNKPILRFLVATGIFVGAYHLIGS
jgi:hypothetical protein